MYKKINTHYNFYDIIGILSFAIVIVVVISTLQNTFILGKQKLLLEPYNFRGNVDIKFHDGSIKHTQIPFSIKTDQAFDVTLYIDNLGMLDGKTMSFISKDIFIRCEVDGSVIYRNISSYSNSTYKDNDILYLIDLPETVNKNIVILHYENYKNYKTIFTLKDLRIGKKTDIVSYYFLQDNFKSIIILLIIVIFIGVLMTGSFFRTDTIIDLYFKYITIFCILLSAYIFSILPLSYFLLYGIETFLHVLQYSALMLLPIPLLKAVSLRVDTKYSIYFKLGIIFASLNTFMQHSLTFSGLNTLNLMCQYSYIILLYAIILILYSTLNTKENNVNKIKYMTYNLIPLFIGLFYEIIFKLIDDTINNNYFFYIPIFIFLLALGYEIFKFQMLSRDKKIQAELYEKLAKIDKLTELGNRMSFSEKILKYKKQKSSFYCIIIDIDNLKYVNDHYGHKYGDAIITSLAELLKKSFDPKYDKDIFRMGGDEFMIIYHAPKDVDISNTLKTMEQIYAQMEIEDNINDFSFSYGYSYYEQKKSTSLDEIIDMADKNMYANKISKKENVTKV